MPWRFLRMEEHFELIRANFIRCEECNENFFFDFLRHPRYFVTHFKACHLKNLLYRFNGYSEEENHKTRFGPRRKRDANAWFGQLKSTEKRMISMQDNKWSEITENECWSCRLCNDGKADLTHVFELNELGRGQAFLHLRQFHEVAYEAFLESLPDVQNAALMSLREGDIIEPSLAPAGTATAIAAPRPADAFASAPIQRSSLAVTSRTIQQRMVEAERSRLRRLRATSEERKTEAIRSKKRRESLTPVQRQADYDRRKRKKKRAEESVRSKKRREDATQETKEKEVLRSRERRRNATDEQRQREALRSRLRRQNATEAQKSKERERCRKRYEAKKAGRPSSSGQGTDDGGDSGHFSDASTDGSAYPSLMPDEHAPPPLSRHGQMMRYGTVPAASSLHVAPPMDVLPPQPFLHSLPFQNAGGGMSMMVPTHSGHEGLSTAPVGSTPRSSSGYPVHSMAMYHQLPLEQVRPTSHRSHISPPYPPPPPPPPPAPMMPSGQADIQLGFAVNPNLQHMALHHDHHDHHPHPFFFESDAALLAGSGFPPLPGGSTRTNQPGDSTAV